MRAAVEALASDCAAAWAANDTAGIAALWDREHFRFYKAEEVDRVFTVFDDMQAYWRTNEAMHDAVQLRFDGIVPLPLEGAWSMAVLHMTWNIRFRSGLPGVGGKAMAGDNHVVMLLRESDAGLRFAGWSETPDAPVSYIRRMYERIAVT